MLGLNQLIDKLQEEMIKAVISLLFLLVIGQLCELDPSFLTRIRNFLLPFKQGITPSMISKAATYSATCYLSFKDRIVVSDCLSGAQKCFFSEVAKHLPDMNLVLNKLDEPRIIKGQCQPNQQWTQCACDPDYVQPKHGFFNYPSWYFAIYQQLPIFSQGTIPSCFNDILMPSDYHLNARPPSRRFSWKDKVFKAIWRGSATGGLYNSFIPDFRDYHRQRLVSLCANISNCDAKFTGYGTCGDVCNAMKIYYGRSARQIPIFSQSVAKIMIDIDGNTYSGRFPQLLYLGSAVFKIKAFEDVATMMSEPWKHYVPIKMDLSDLTQKLEWARANDRELQKIARGGMEHALSKLTRQGYVCYMISLLREYYQLLI